MKRLCQICSLPLCGKQRKYCDKCKHKVHLKQMSDNYKNNKDEWLSKDGKYIRDNQKCLGRVSGQDHWHYGKHLSDETKEKCRIAHLGENNPMYGRIGNKNPMYGVHRFGKDCPNWKDENIIIKCDYCGKNIKKIKSKIRNHNFCNQECFGKWKSENIIGENNPNWRGGIANIRDHVLPTWKCIKLNKRFRRASYIIRSYSLYT